jgi:uncharacterized protein (TIGR02145 family)
MMAAKVGTTVCGRPELINTLQGMSQFLKYGLLCVMIGMALSAFPQVPERMSFQAVIRDGKGELVANHRVGIRIQIKQGSLFGPAAYVETHNPVTDEYGLASLEIGGGKVVLGSFSGIPWENGPYFLQTETDPAGGASYSIIGVSQVLSVPYALHAKSADAITGSLNETDPAFSGSVAEGITGSDTASWNHMQQDIIETDPYFMRSVSKNITAADTEKWNRKINVETQNLGDVLAKGNDGRVQQIRNLARPVHLQDVATKAYVDEISARLSMLNSTLYGAGPVTDADGNVYNTAKYGDYVWMTENLRTGQLNDGTAIPLIMQQNSWIELTTPGYCWYHNDKVAYGSPYGALYNAFAVNTGKLCPIGWHVPGNAEWSTLAYLLGGRDVAGGKMKEAGKQHWIEPNTGADNSSGFSGMPGGDRYYSFGHSSEEGFANAGYQGCWWSASGNFFSHHVYRLLNNQIYLDEWNFEEKAGVSVRCKMDDNLSMAVIPTVTTAIVTDILQNTAVTGGSVSNDGGSTVVAKGVCWSTGPNPGTGNYSTLDGFAPGDFNSLVTGLIPNTTYYVRAYATNGVGTGYGKVLTFTTLEDHSFGSVTDVEGNEYKTVVIGTQIWMAENLKTTRFNDNQSMPQISGSSGSSGYCWYHDEEAKYKDPYGAMYTWYAVSTGKICPSGWKVPDLADWDTLRSYLGNNATAGAKLREAGTAHWPEALDATNETGFTALPGGSYANGIFSGLGEVGYWWTADEFSGNDLMAWQEYMYPINTALSSGFTDKSHAYSVRCLKE